MTFHVDETVDIIKGSAIKEGPSYALYQ